MFNEQQSKVDAMRSACPKHEQIICVDGSKSICDECGKPICKNCGLCYDVP